MKKRHVFTFVLFIFVTAVSVAVPSFAEEKDKYVVGMPLLEEMAESKIADLLQDVVDTVAAKMDVDAEVVVIKHQHDDNVMDIVVSNMEAGRFDISFLMGMHYVEYLASGNDIAVPLFSVEMGGITAAKNCIYVRKGEFKDLNELRGKRWAGAEMLPTRYHLYKNGIDEPLESFFGELHYVTDSPVTEIAGGLEAGDYDAFSTLDYYIAISGYNTKKDLPFEPLHCQTAEHTNIFVAHRDMPRERMKEFRKIMLRSRSDPDFAKFEFAFMMIRGGFVPFDKEEVEPLKEAYELAVKNGWYEEEKNFWKKYMSE